MINAKKDHLLLFCNGHGDTLRKPFSVKNKPEGITHIVDQVTRSCRRRSELCPNSPEFPIPAQKINIDNKARFRYQLGYWFRLIDASISGPSAEADTQFSIFDSSASEKQPLILYLFSPAPEKQPLIFKS